MIVNAARIPAAVEDEKQEFLATHQIQRVARTAKGETPMYKAICKPARRTPTEDYSLLFIETGRFTMIEQGFGVCDRVADAVNAGRHDPTSEIGEIVAAITKESEQ